MSYHGGPLLHYHPNNASMVQLYSKGNVRRCGLPRDSQYGAGGPRAKWLKVDHSMPSSQSMPDMAMNAAYNAYTGAPTSANGYHGGLYEGQSFQQQSQTGPQYSGDGVGQTQDAPHKLNTPPYHPAEHMAFPPSGHYNIQPQSISHSNSYYHGNLSERMLSQPPMLLPPRQPLSSVTNPALQDAASLYGAYGSNYPVSNSGSAETLSDLDLYPHQKVPVCQQTPLNDQSYPEPPRHSSGDHQQEAPQQQLLDAQDGSQDSTLPGMASFREARTQAEWQSGDHVTTHVNNNAESTTHSSQVEQSTDSNPSDTDANNDHAAIYKGDVQNGVDKKDYVIVQNYASDAGSSQPSNSQEPSPRASQDNNTHQDKADAGSPVDAESAYVQNSLTTLAAVACSVTQPSVPAASTNTATVSLQGAIQGGHADKGSASREKLSAAKAEVQKITAGECISGALEAIFGDTLPSNNTTTTNSSYSQVARQVTCASPHDGAGSGRSGEVAMRVPGMERPVDLLDNQEAYGHERFMYGNLTKPGRTRIEH